MLEFYSLSKYRNLARSIAIHSVTEATDELPSSPCIYTNNMAYLLMKLSTDRFEAENTSSRCSSSAVISESSTRSRMINETRLITACEIGKFNTRAL